MHESSKQCIGSSKRCSLETKRAAGNNSSRFFRLLMKKILFFIRCLFLSLVLDAQVIQGDLVDTSGSPIPLATLSFYEDETSEQDLGFTLAKNGKFSFRLPRNSTAVYVVVKVPDYESYTRLLPTPDAAQTYYLSIVLTPTRYKELKEVEVVAAPPPVKVNGDTTIYNHKRFLDGTERKLEDVLKKLPGISVNSTNGEIRFNGRPINTILLEGENLFGKDYTIASRNINADAIAEIQAIDKYAENPLLKGFTNKDEVVLNLKMQKGKSDWSAFVETAGGVFANDQAAFDSKVTGILINPAVKAFGTVSYNNVGQNYSSSNIHSGEKSLSNAENADYITDQLIPDSKLNAAGVPRSRSLFNNQLLGSLAGIWKIADAVNLKINTIHGKDRIRNNENFDVLYTFNNNTFATQDVSQKEYNENSGTYNGRLRYFPGKKFLLDGLFQYWNNDQLSKESIFSNNSIGFNQSLQSTSEFISGSLQGTYLLNKQYLLQSAVTVASHRLPQTFELFTKKAPGDASIRDFQQLQTAYKTHSGTLKLSGKNSANRLLTQAEYGFTSKRRDLGSSLTNNENVPFLSDDSLKNQVAYNTLEHFLDLGFTYKLNELMIAPNLQLRRLDQHWSDQLTAIDRKQQNWLVDPSLRIGLKILKYSSLTTSISFRRQINELSYQYGHPIRINNRSFINNRPTLRLRSNLVANAGYTYNNLFSQSQLMLGGTWQVSKGVQLEAYNINDRFVRVEYFFSPVTVNTVQTNQSFAKFLPFLSTTIKLEMFWGWQRYFNSVNNQLRTNHNFNQLTKLLIKSAWKFPVNVENEISINNTRFRPEGGTANTNTFLSNYTKLIVKAGPKLTATISNESVYPSLGNANGIHFSDASMYYTLKDSRAEIGLLCRNLFNTGIFRFEQPSDFSISTYQYNLLPRLFLLQFSYSF